MALNNGKSLVDAQSDDNERKTLGGDYTDLTLVSVISYLVLVIFSFVKRAGKKVKTESGWGSIWAVGYAIYQYRILRYMDSEIRAIMAQYMPLDNQPNNHQDI
ncbi:hypothetical protein V6N12_028771 [Hibiscus sabdariffa]|uniref:Uncharacterized protein n=1 Tax=Hibiscus sabdariffa TaxID=183260 RepID=A0ABR2F6S1_9ROSI